MRLQDLPEFRQMRTMSGGVDPKNKQLYEELRRTGSMLLQQGKIDELTYRTKLRDAGVELNLIGKDEFPDRLPTGVETGLEIAGGITGAIIGAPSIGGAAIGAGVGAGAGSLVADYLGDLFNPNVPSPSTQKRFKDAAQIGLIDTALTAAVPVFGKGLATAGRAAMGGFKTSGQRIADAGKEKVAGMIPDDAVTQEKSISLINRLAGIDKEGQEAADVLKPYGIRLTTSQGTSNPLLVALADGLNRMPVVGAPGQKVAREQQAKIKEALENFGTGKAASQAEFDVSNALGSLTDEQLADVMTSSALKTVNKQIDEASRLYKKGDEANRKKGNYFSLRPINDVFDNFRKTNKIYETEELPADFGLITRYLGKQSEAGINKVNIDRVKELKIQIDDLVHNYNPDRLQGPLGQGKRTNFSLLVKDLNDAFNKQYKDNWRTDDAAAFYKSGDRSLKKYKGDLSTQVGKEIQKVLGSDKFRRGFSTKTRMRKEDLAKKIFRGNYASPAAVRELKELVGNDKNVMNALAGNRLDNLFIKRLRGEKQEYDALFKDLGFNNRQSAQYQATKELLDGYDNVGIEELESFLTALQRIPEAAPDVNKFVGRGMALRMSQGITPMAMLGIVGAGGAAAGGPLGGLAGMGLLYALNKFLARPFTTAAGRTVGDEITGGALKGLNAIEEKEFMQKFVAYLNRLTDAMPSAPTGAIPIQTVVPMLDDQFQQSNVPMLQEQNVGQAMRP